MKSAKCPICSASVSAEGEDALVKQLQQHAKHEHNRTMNRRQVKDIIDSQSVK